jgi:hypothetical protein
MNEKSIDPGSEIPMEKKPVEKTAEQIEAEKQAEIKRTDIAEMSSKHTTVTEKAIVISIGEATASVPSGKEISVMQSVRNPGEIIVHLAPGSDNARIFGTGHAWTPEKLYEKFGAERFKEIAAVVQAWDELMNKLAITELPE